MFNIFSGITTLVNTLGRRRIWLLTSLAVLATTVACSSSATSTPLPQGPEVNVIVVTSDYGVGSNRVAFGLVDREGTPVRSTEAQVRALYLPAGQSAGEVRDTATAKFRQWPIGAQGLFTTNLEFDTEGFWEIQVDTTNTAGKAVTARAAIQVQPETITPSIGRRPPTSVTPTGDQVAVYWNRWPQRGLWILSWPGRVGRFVAPGRLEPVGWSPDEEWIYAYQPDGRELMKVEANGGTVEAVVQFPVGSLVGIGACDQSADRRVVVCSVAESSTDVWLIEDFDRAVPSTP